MRCGFSKRQAAMVLKPGYLTILGGGVGHVRQCGTEASSALHCMDAPPTPALCMLCVWILYQARGTEASSAPHCLAILGKRSKLGFHHAPGSLSGNAVLKQAPHYAAWTIRSKVIPLTFQCMVGSVVGTRRWTAQRSYAKVVCPCGYVLNSSHLVSTTSA